MASTNELITLIKNFSLTERLYIIEEVLKSIREEKVVLESDKKTVLQPKILDLAGIIDDKEAEMMKTAVLESRKTDLNEW